MNIKKMSVLLLFIFLINSCSFIKELSIAVSDGTKDIASEIKEKQYQKEKDTENWDVEKLDTAVDKDYLTLTEKNVVLEVNKVRTNPKKYAELYLEPRLKNYSGKEYITGSVTIVTNEGRKVVEECILFLKRHGALSVLNPEVSLYNLARNHVESQGPTGKTGHESPSGDSFQVRASRFIDSSMHGYGENISYGSTSAREIVIQLLVDDGVPSRGHRKNIMNNTFNLIGVSYGKHKQYGSMCVIDFGKK